MEQGWLDTRITSLDKEGLNAFGDLKNSNAIEMNRGLADRIEGVKPKGFCFFVQDLEN